MFAIFFGFLGLAARLLARGLIGTTETRLSFNWRWLALPLTSAVCLGLFAVLRPFIVDQPRTPLWFVLGFLGVALLFAGAVTLATTITPAATVVRSSHGVTRPQLMFSFVVVVAFGLHVVAGINFVLTHKAGPAF